MSAAHHRVVRLVDMVNETIAHEGSCVVDCRGSITP
jgi:hypothetical protein